MLKQDFSELFETLQRLEVQSFISGPLPARGTNMFSRLLGLNTWLQRTCSTKGVNFIDNFNPLTQSPGQNMSDHRLHISFRVIMWLKNPTRILITPHSQNNHCSWTSRLSPAHRAHHMQTVTYHNSSKTQHPRTTFWKTAWDAMTTHYSHRKHQS